jgi:hypothetical protein
MITLDQYKKLKQIFEHFGLLNQMDKLQEEIHELTEARIKAPWGKMPDGCVIEEMVDCFVLLSQILGNYPGEVHPGIMMRDRIKEMIEYKINRTLERIESGYYEQND